MFKNLFYKNDITLSKVNQFKMGFTAEKSSTKKIEITEYARLSVNPLRKLTFEQKVQPNPGKKTITLQLGDPTAFGNFPPPKKLVEAFRKAVETDTFLYNPNAGRLDAREAVAKYSQSRGNITADDIILTSGK